MGARVGVPWLGWTCGECRYCRLGRENLCDRALFTGYTLDGGFAEDAVADARFCLPAPRRADDLELAPLLCAGLIGYRALRPPATAAARAVRLRRRRAHRLRRSPCTRGAGSSRSRAPATPSASSRALGAEWAGAVGERPDELDAAIIFAPAGELVPEALAAVARAARWSARAST